MSSYDWCCKAYIRSNCPVNKCAGMSEMILSEPRQQGNPNVLIRKNGSASLCGFIFMEAYNPLCFSFGQHPGCSWWHLHWGFSFDLWMSSALGWTHFVFQLGLALGLVFPSAPAPLPWESQAALLSPMVSHTWPPGQQWETPSLKALWLLHSVPFSPFLRFLSTQ